MPEDNRVMEAEVPMSNAMHLADMLALKALNTKLTHHLNAIDLLSLLDCFTAEAVYKEGNQSALGPGRIVVLLKESIKGSVVRQIFTDPYLELLDEGKARGRFLRIVFDLSASGPWIRSVSDVNDCYELCSDERWRIATRSVKLIF
jgi:SnoaL-like domain